MDDLKKALLGLVGASREDLTPSAISTPAEIEAALCELEGTYSARLADIENALCDIDGGDLIWQKSGQIG